MPNSGKPQELGFAGNPGQLSGAHIGVPNEPPRNRIEVTAGA